MESKARQTPITPMRNLGQPGPCNLCSVKALAEPSYGSHSSPWYKEALCSVWRGGVGKSHRLLGERGDGPPWVP